MLGPRQRNLLHHLLLSPTLKEAAAAAGVPYGSAKRYARTEEFKTAYGMAQEKNFEHACAMLKYSSAQAVALLAKELSSCKAGDRIRAAKAILAIGKGLIETIEVIRRLDALEQREKARSEHSRNGAIN